MLEAASAFTNQAQSLSEEAEQLKDQTAVPLPELRGGIMPAAPEEQGPKVVEVISGLVPEKEAELFPSLRGLGKKKKMEGEKSPLSDIFFAYDQSFLSEEAQSILERNAGWLRSHSEPQILVEGHCDERGSVEYNLALGERRAQSVKDYLINMGIGKDRLYTISYGKERPFAFGHTEEAWAQNRRAHFLLRSP
jgi:peptidoglycan-associated lipoprotein